MAKSREKAKRMNSHKENGHWEMHYDPTPHGEEKNQSMRNWDPMFSKDRPCTHVKINDADH